MLRTTRKETDSSETTSRDRGLQQLLFLGGGRCTGVEAGGKQGASQSSGEGSDLFSTLYGSLLLSLSNSIWEQHVDKLNTEVII